jgi:organic radical activating enzyme
MDNFKKTRDSLNKVGPGFCLQKWRNETLYLHTGDNHSCYHPRPNKTPLAEIKVDVSALHNTKWKKEQRKTMLEGGRPEECYYCWNIEDLSGDHFSDRSIHNSSDWLDVDKEIELIKNQPWDTNYNPYYLEMSFSNNCNFKCGYCCPQSSTLWIEEIKKNGNYDLTYNQYGIEFLDSGSYYPDDENNPYVDAFWEWWPDLFKDLHTFRITGGEPLLAKDTFKVLEYIQEHSDINPNISLAINTNLGSPDAIIDRFIEIAKDLSDNNKVRELIIFTSVEAVGKQAEYTRNGLDYDKFWTNVEKILTVLPKVTINIMSTFNALSVFTYSDLIERVFQAKKKYSNNQRYWISAIQLDTSYLRYPSHLSVKILDKKHKDLILESAKKALYYGMTEFVQGSYGFSNTEIQKIKRLYDYAIHEDEFDVEKNRKDFVKFVDELDKRRDTNFVKTFPELKKFYDTYKKI